MFQAQGSIIVQRQVEEVFALLPYAATNNMRGSALESIESIRADLRERNFSSSPAMLFKRDVPPKVEIGSTFQTQALGSSIQTITYKVVELEPNRKLTLEQQTVGTFAASAITSYELEPVAEGTRLIMTGEADAKGCVWLIYKAFDSIPWIKQLAVSFDLRVRKRMLEQGVLLQPGHRISGPLPALDEGQLPTEAAE
jgi:hypothetical protein